MRPSLPAETSADELALTAKQILDSLGFAAKVNCGLLVDCSHSMADEFGLDKKLRPNPELPNQIQRFALLWLALARCLDPNGIAQGGFFSEIAQMGQPIELNNSTTWVDDNRLKPADMGGTDMVAGLRMMLEGIAGEMESDLVPELGHFGDSAHHGKVPEHPIKAQPYVLALITDGEPEDVAAIENILRASSWAPILFLVLYVSNQKAGLNVLETLTHIKHRHMDNVQLINLGKDGLAKASDEELLRALAEGLPAFYKAIAERDLIAG